MLPDHVGGEPVFLARTLEEILNDRYILNRTSPQQLRRLLENPDLVRALGNDTIESVRTTMTSV